MIIKSNPYSAPVLFLTGRNPGWKFLKKKKKDTTPNFLHSVPKKGVESEYDIHFGQILAKEIKYGFLCQKVLILLKKVFFWMFF